MNIVDLQFCKIIELRQILSSGRLGAFPVSQGLKDQAAQEILRRAENVQVDNDLVLQARMELGE